VAELGEALADGVLAHDGWVELFADAAFEEVLSLGGPGGGVGLATLATLQRDQFVADAEAEILECGPLGFEGGGFAGGCLGVGGFGFSGGCGRGLCCGGCSGGRGRGGGVGGCGRGRGGDGGRHGSDRCSLDGLSR